MTKPNATLEQFRADCNIVYYSDDDMIARLYMPLRAVMEAVYCQRMGMRRHLDDLEADAVLGLVEGVRGGMRGDDLYRYVLQHVEVHRMRPMQSMLECQVDRSVFDRLGSNVGGFIANWTDDGPSPEERAEVSEQEALGMRLENDHAVRRALHRAGRCRDLKVAIERLSIEDQELVRLHYRQGLTIRAIAARKGISGPSVCNQLKRVRARLRVLVEIPEITPDEMRRDLTEVVALQRIPGYDPVEALAVYYETMNQCETADRMGVNQSRVSYTVRQTIARLAGVYRLRRYRRALSIIVENKWRWSRRGE